MQCFPPVQQGARTPVPERGWGHSQAARLYGPHLPAVRRALRGADSVSTRVHFSRGADSLRAWVGGGRPQPLAFSSDCSNSTSPAMNRFSTRLMGATSTPPPAQPKPAAMKTWTKLICLWVRSRVGPSWSGRRCGWNQLPWFVGKGRLGAAVAGVFLRSGRNQGRAGGDLGARRARRCRGSGSGGLGDPSGGLCLRGRRALWVGTLGRSRVRTLFPLRRAPPLAGDPGSLWGKLRAFHRRRVRCGRYQGARGHGSDGANLSKESSSRAGLVRLNPWFQRRASWTFCALGAVPGVAEKRQKPLELAISDRQQTARPPRGAWQKILRKGLHGMVMY